MSLRRTWAGSVIEVGHENFWRWFKGWALWTLELRPRSPCHDHQAEHPDFPPPVKPWRETRARYRASLQKQIDQFNDEQEG